MGDLDLVTSSPYTSAPAASIPTLWRIQFLVEKTILSDTGLISNCGSYVWNYSGFSAAAAGLIFIKCSTCGECCGFSGTAPFLLAQRQVESPQCQIYAITFFWRYAQLYRKPNRIRFFFNRILRTGNRMR
jgi:hypothetical protein